MRSMLAVAALLLAGTASAGEKKWYDRIDVSGYVDVYYAFDTNNPDSFDSFIPGYGTSGKKHNQLTLNLAALDISVTDPVIVHLVLNYGTATEVLHAGEPKGTAAGPEVWKYIQQAYVGWKAPLGRGLTLEAGIFPSHVGFELLPSKDNWNYTRGWLAESSPYYQAGVRISYPFTDRLSAQLLYLNGWQTIGEDNGWKTLGTQVQYTHPRFSLVFNTLLGPEQPRPSEAWRFYFDGIATVSLGRLQLAAELDWGFEMLRPGGLAHFYGGAAFARVAILKWLALAARAEVYHDGLGSPPDSPRVLTGTVQTLADGTLTVEFRVYDRLILKVEGRYDHSTAPVFEAHGRALLTPGPRQVNDQGLVLAGAVATF